jgi:hypothetical protein
MVRVGWGVIVICSSCGRKFNTVYLPMVCELTGQGALEAKAEPICPLCACNGVRPKGRGRKEP